MPCHLHLDFETFSEVDIREVGAYRYAFDPSTEILCAAMAFDDEEPQIWDCTMDEIDAMPLDPYLDALLDPSVLIYAHNAMFESAICQALLMKTWGIPAPALDRFRCTMSLARRASLPGKLEKLAEVLHLSEQKDKRGKALIKKFCEMQSAKKPTKKNPSGLPPHRIRPQDDPAAFAELLDYCKQDVRTEQAVYRKLSYFADALNDANYVLDQKINARGVPVNLAALRHAQTLIDEETEIVSRQFRELTGFEVTQGKVFLAWLHAQGVHLDNLQAETIETFLEPFDALPYEGVTGAVKALRLKQSIAYVSIKKVRTMLACAGPHDNRIRGMMNHHGATTGRWTASLVQFQNMKRPTIKHSEDAYREICEGVSREMLELCYGPVLEVLSSTIRHYLHDVCPVCSGTGEGDLEVEGILSCGACGACHEPSFLDADYSAIEARITCWLAGQEDALAEYRQGVDRYVNMASVIYHIPPAQVNKHPQRFVGKSAILGCGFGMGAPKFRTTVKKQGRYDLPEGLEFTAVAGWRAKHKKVVSYWYDMERAAKNAILHKGKVFEVRKHIKFLVKDVEGMPFLLMRLPSGRKLAYPKPRLCGDRIAFFGNTVGTNWGDLSTWGGSLVENCLGGDTEVLSQFRGWVRMDSVTTADRLWDGVEFVEHEGLIDKGVQRVQDFYGLRATPEHMFLTTESLWVSVQTACTYPHIQLYSPHEPEKIPSETMATAEHHGKQIRQHGGAEDAPDDPQENVLALQMRLRSRSGEARLRPSAKEPSSHRLQQELPNLTSSDCKEQDDSRDDQTPRLSRLASNDRPLPSSTASGMAQLRGARNLCLRRVGGIFRAVLEGYGADVSARSGHRPRGQQWGLHSTELPVGNSEAEQQKQAGHTSPARVSSRLLGHRAGEGNQAEHVVLPHQSGPELGANHPHAVGLSEQVYDIRNCGPRHRFAVRGRTGRVLIAHNCVQAVAADIMANGSHKAEGAGYQIATLIHDQALAYHGEGQTAERFVELLTDLPPWADGLPIEAEGGVVPFYKKD